MVRSSLDSKNECACSHDDSGGRCMSRACARRGNGGGQRDSVRAAATAKLVNVMRKVKSSADEGSKQQGISQGRRIPLAGTSGLKTVGKSESMFSRKSKSISVSRQRTPVIPRMEARHRILAHWSGVHRCCCELPT